MTTIKIIDSDTSQTCLEIEKVKFIIEDYVGITLTLFFDDLNSIVNKIFKNCDYNKTYFIQILSNFVYKCELNYCILKDIDIDIRNKLVKVIFAG